MGLGKSKLGILRLIKLPPMSGFAHMALDHALLISSQDEDFLPALRFQNWNPPAISLGRFQDIEELDLKRCKSAGVEVVRRPTGGKALLHMEDFTYSIVLPPHYPLPHDLEGSYLKISGGIVKALRELGLRADMGDEPATAYRAKAACFASGNAADVKVNGRKICGSAQLRKKGSVLQHGTLYLEDRSSIFYSLLRYPSEEDRARALFLYQEACTTLEEAIGEKISIELLERTFISGFEEELELEIVESDLTSKERCIWNALIKSYKSLRWILNRERKNEPDLHAS